jgi:anaerobic selenocysteine-containing dehydrogenase
MGVVQSSKGVLKPVSNKQMSEPAIVCKLAKETLGDRTKINWNKYLFHYDAIRDDIERTIPGFDDYNKKVRAPGGFYLPNCNRDGLFDTKNSKANFNIAAMQEHILADDQLMMMTIRSHDQFNTTIYGLNDRYRGIHNERRIIFMNENDMKKFNLENNDIVDIHNDHDGIRRTAHKFMVVAYPIPQGCTATYFPEANVLVPISSVAEKSNTPTSKLVIIRVEKTIKPSP